MSIQIPVLTQHVTRDIDILIKFREIKYIHLIVNKIDKSVTEGTRMGGEALGTFFDLVMH